MIERGAAHRAEPLVVSGGRRRNLPPSCFFSVRARNVIFEMIACAGSKTGDRRGRQRRPTDAGCEPVLMI
jgi:hypothetical protein